MAKGGIMKQKNLKLKRENSKLMREFQAVDIIDKGWDYLNSGRKSYPCQGECGIIKVQPREKSYDEIMGEVLSAMQGSIMQSLERRYACS